MIAFKLVTVIMMGFMVGCAAIMPEESAPAEPAAQTAPELTPPTLPKSQMVEATANTKANKKNVATAIDPKVLYLLLAAEIAGQRNQYGVALEGYMQAASRVNDPRVTERAAKIALFLDDRKKADKAVSLWLHQDAKNLDAQTLAALSALRAGHKAQALEHLEALLKLDVAGFQDTLLELLKSLEQTEKLKLLAEILEDLVRRYPDKASIYFVQSLLAMQLNDNKVAEVKLQRALELQPNWDKALMAQAQLAVLNEDLSGAQAVLRAAGKQYPEDVRFKKMLAQVLIKAEQLDAAMAEYQAILQAHPEDGDSAFSLALLHLQLQQDAEGQQQLEKLLSQPEWASQASYYLGKLAAKNAQLDKALTWFNSVTNGPFEFDAALAAVSILVEQRRFDEAHARLDNLLRVFPEQRIRLLALRAEIYNDQKQYAKAFAMLSEALVKLPEQKELLYTRALVAERMNDLATMEADLRRILRTHPEDVATLNALGYTLVDKTTRLKEAERYLQKAIALQPEVAVIVDSYGWLLFKQGKLAEAKTYLQKAYAKQPQAEIAGHLIEVLMQLRQYREAQALLEKALQIDKDDEYLLKLKRRFFAN